MRGKKVHFSLPPVLRIRDYALGYRASIPYTPDLCLGHLHRFSRWPPVEYRYAIMLLQENRHLRVDVPLGEQGVREGDAIRIVPMN